MEITLENVKELWGLYEEYRIEYKKQCRSFKELSEIYSFEEFVDNEVVQCEQCKRYIIISDILENELSMQDNICRECMEEGYGR